jgi:hypothetical protein
LGLKGASHSAFHGALVQTAVLTARRMGELEPWIDENFVRSIWYNMGETVNVKMIRDKFSG